jgi:F-type H+-transporting ATPase subunit alpha
LTEVPLDQVTRFEKEFLNALEAGHREDVLDPLERGEMSDQIGEIIEKVAHDTIFTMKR